MTDTSLVTIPEVFGKINLAQFPPPFLKWRIANWKRDSLGSNINLEFMSVTTDRKIKLDTLAENCFKVQYALAQKGTKSMGKQQDIDKQHFSPDNSFVSAFL